VLGAALGKRNRGAHRALAGGKIRCRGGPRPNIGDEGGGSRRGPAPWRKWHYGMWHAAMGHTYIVQQGKWEAHEWAQRRTIPLLIYSIEFQTDSNLNWSKMDFVAQIFSNKIWVSI
jgi:hypothetical protein